MKNLIVLLLMLIAVSCNQINIKDKEDVFIESKKDCLQRLLNEESRKFNSYSTKFLEYLHTDKELRNAYSDSINMSSYAADLIINEMYPTKK